MLALPGGFLLETLNSNIVSNLRHKIITILFLYISVICLYSEPADGKIRFRKPTKRSQVDTSDLKASSSKKKKDDKKKKDKSRSGKKVKNSSLLSFGDDEGEEGT